MYVHTHEHTYIHTILCVAQYMPHQMCTYHEQWCPPNLQQFPSPMIYLNYCVCMCVCLSEAVQLYTYVSLYVCPCPLCIYIHYCVPQHMQQSWHMEIARHKKRNNVEFGDKKIPNTPPSPPTNKLRITLPWQQIICLSDL